jgi:hypothetical protein
MSRTLIAVSVILGVLSGCGKGPAETGGAGDDTAAIAFDPNQPQQCAACHQAVVAEWETSLHRRAHTSRDPIFAAVHQVRSAREGADMAKNCANCHSPAGSTPELADLGVTCSTCHQTRAIDRSGGKMGLAALMRTAPNEVVGPHGSDIAAGAPHALAIAEPTVFDGSTLCLSCHEQLANKDGIAACSTGIEWRDGHRANGQSCVDCHMPWVDGPNGVTSPARTRHRSHAFIGPHLALRDPAQDLAQGALSLALGFEGDSLEVTLANKTQHAWPTGFPGRFAVVVLVGFDAAGQQVWSNFTDEPMKQHPDAVLNKVYLDADGKPTLAPYAKTLARDNRLKTDETRTFSVTVPAEVIRVEGKLMSRLVAPPLAKMLQLGELPELKPRAVATAKAQR